MGYINSILGVINLSMFATGGSNINLLFGVLCLGLGLMQLHRERS